MRQRVRRAFPTDHAPMRTPRPLPLAIALSALLPLLSGCAQIDDLVGNEASTERVLTGGFRTLSERYIENVDFRKHATSGLNRLTDIDPDIDVSIEDRSVKFKVQETVTSEWPAPEPFDYEGWARVSAQFVTAARANSTVVGAQSPEDLYSTLFDGTLAGLDRYTRYASAKLAKQRQAARDGFGGLGISINLTDGRTTIVKIYPNTPAAAAGLQPNDVITHVDTKPISGISLPDIVGLLRGPIDSKVELTVVRPRVVEPLFVSIGRGRIVIPTVTSQRDGALLIITISGFNHGTASSARRQIKEALEQDGPSIDGIVLDLRGNPGGLLDQSVRIADLFLNDGLIIRTKGRHRHSDQVFDATWGEVAPKMRLAVLVNGRSASASEIVAGALRDRGRAVILGSTSYGKGSVQTIIGLPNGGELTLTWAHMITPAGYRLQDRGVVPAVCTNGDAVRMDRLREILRTRKGGLTPFIISRARGSAVTNVAGQSARESCPPNANEPKTDLEIARMILSDERLYTRILEREMPAVAAR